MSCTLHVRGADQWKQGLRIDVGLGIPGGGLGALHRSLIWGLRYGRFNATELRSVVVRGHGQAAWVRGFPNQLQ
jgi:hypothetical protein